MARKKNPYVILWSASRDRWEVWRESREVAHSVDLERCTEAYPDALVGPGPGSPTPPYDERGLVAVR